MFFLSCLSQPALAVASIGGVSLGVTLLLLPWKSMTSGNSSSIQSLVTQSEGNCTIINNFGITISEIRGQQTDYYSIFCENIWQGAKLDIPDKFQGAFPKAIFKERDWNESKKLEIKVTTDPEDTFPEFDTSWEEEDYLYIRKITFSGKQFIDTESSLLTGKMKYHDFDSGDGETRSGAIVKLTHPEINEKIYLLPDELNTNVLKS